MTETKKIKAVFLDRDGTINVDTGYTHNPGDFRFEKNALQGIILAAKHGYKIIVITSQSGIARGYYTEDHMHAFNNHLIGELSRHGVYLGMNQFYFCPHHPTKAAIEKYKIDCDCRKPKPGLLLKAAQEHDIDIAKSYMVGDKYSDIGAGIRAGCRGSILVKCGKDMDNKGEKREEPSYIAEDLQDAIKFMIRTDEKTKKKIKHAS